MSTLALLQKHAEPTDADIDAEVTNACRCSTYHRIRQSIHLAADLMRGAGDDVRRQSSRVSRHRRRGPGRVRARLLDAVEGERADDATARRALVPGSGDAGGQRLDRHLARRHGHDPHRADRARPGRLDVQRDDGLRGAAVRLEQGAPAGRLREPRRPGDGARVDAESTGQRRHRSERRRRADVRQSRSHRRGGHSRQPVPAHADERGVVGEGWPLLPAAGRSRGA